MNKPIKFMALLLALALGCDAAAHTSLPASTIPTPAYTSAKIMII